MSRHHRAANWSTTTQRLRPKYQPIVDSGNAVCGRCHLPIMPGQRWDIGHITDLSSGLPGAGYQTEHAMKRDCPKGGNRSAGGKLGAAKTNRGKTVQRQEDRRLPDV